MLEAVVTFFANLETWVLALAESAWIYPLLFSLAFLDGVFPPVPSETVLIALAVSAVASGTPHLALVLLVAAAGAWAGDQLAFALGRAVGSDRFRFLRGTRGRRAASWAERALATRGASFIIAARYVPVGRVAVNFTAGAVGVPRRRFMVLSGVGGVTWAAYSVLIGVAAGRWLGGAPLIAMAVGVGSGILVGIVVDRIFHRRARGADPQGTQPARTVAARPLVPAD